MEPCPQNGWLSSGIPFNKAPKMAAFLMAPLKSNKWLAERGSGRTPKTQKKKKKKPNNPKVVQAK